jgi:hypothetical protein
MHTELWLGDLGVKGDDLSRISWLKIVPDDGIL